MMKEFIQKFRRIVRENMYKRRPLIKDFKREMNRTVYQRLMKLEQQPVSIKQWYEWAINLDRNQRESRREEKRLREQYKQGPQIPRSNNQEVQQKQMSQSQGWPRRQEALQQQALTGPTPIEGIERMNAVIVHLNQQAGLALCNTYTMEVD